MKSFKHLNDLIILGHSVKQLLPKSKEDTGCKLDGGNVKVKVHAGPSCL